MQTEEVAEFLNSQNVGHEREDELVDLSVSGQHWQHRDHDLSLGFQGFIESINPFSSTKEEIFKQNQELRLRLAQSDKQVNFLLVFDNSPVDHIISVQALKMRDEQIEELWARLKEAHYEVETILQ